jgi:prevent-host-death family protein
MNAPANIKTVNMLEAKTHLSRLVQSVEHGDGEVIISRNGKPVAKLVPFADKKPPINPIGVAKGRFHLPDDFDDDKKEVEKLFYGDGSL